MQRRREAGNALGLWYQPDELASVAAQAPGQLLGRHVIHEMAQGLHEGLVRHAEILVAAAGEDCHPLVVHLPGELRRQAGLAHARLPRQQRQPQVAGGRLLPQLPEPLHLVLTGDEDRPLLGEQNGQWNKRREGRPANLANGNRLGEPLELEGADIGEADPSGAATGHHLHNRGGEDLPGARRLHETSGLDYRRAEDVAVLEAHISQPHADPDGQWGLGGNSLSLDGLLHGHRTFGGVGGRTEDGQDPVSHGLDLFAAGSLDGLAQRGEVGAANVVKGRLAQRGHELRGAHEVREQDRRCSGPQIHGGVVNAVVVLGAVVLMRHAVPDLDNAAVPVEADPVCAGMVAFVADRMREIERDGGVLVDGRAQELGFVMCPKVLEVDEDVIPAADVRPMAHLMPDDVLAQKVSQGFPVSVVESRVSLENGVPL